MSIWHKLRSYYRGMDNSTWPYIYGFVLLLVMVIVGIPTYNPPPSNERDPLTLQALDDLTNEMVAMEHISNARYEEIRSTWGQRSFQRISVRFSSELTYKEVIAHYSRQLENRGWIYDHVYYDQSVDTGNTYTITFYKKSGYTAKISIKDGYFYLTFEWLLNKRAVSTKLQ